MKGDKRLNRGESDAYELIQSRQRVRNAARSIVLQQIKETINDDKSNLKQ